MGKNLLRQDSDVHVPGNYPGCFWGITHILDHHSWHNVKKMIPHKKHERGSRSPVTISKNHGDSEAVELLNDESEHVLAEQYRTKATHDNRSGKSRIKLLIVEEMSREDSNKHRNSIFPEQSHFHQANSIHHLDPLNDSPEDITKNQTYPVSGTSAAKSHDSSLQNIPKEQLPFPQTFDKTEETLGKNQKILQSNQLKREFFNQQFKEQVETLETFKVNKKIFMKILRDPDVGTNNLDSPKYSKSKVGLAKSRSFPSVDLSRTRFSRPSTLKHKQNESFPKGEKILPSTQAPNHFAFEYQNNYNTKEAPNTTLKHRGWNQSVISRFNYIKQKIKDAFKEAKKGNNRPRLPGKSEIITEQDCTYRLQSCNGIDGSGYDQRNDRVQKTRKSSLSESLERYTKLFEYSINEEVKLHHSRSLKLKNGGTVLNSVSAPRSFRRNLSVPDAELFLTFSSAAMMVGSVVESAITRIDNHVESSLGIVPETTEKFELQDVVETKWQSHMVERSERSEDIGYSDHLTVGEYDEEIDKLGELNKDSVEPEITERSHHQEVFIGSEINAGMEHAEPSQVSVIGTCLPQDLNSSPIFPISEGSELNAGCTLMGEIDLRNESIEGFSTFVGSGMDHDNTSDTHKILDTHLHHELDSMIGNNILGTWHSADQSLNPLIFNKLEAFFPDELECYEKEIVIKFCYQLLFDLVNETLKEIYERSCTYFPKALSSNRKICSMLMSQCVLEEVRARIKWHLSLRPELDRSMNDVVARDLAKGDGWMNLQFDIECVPLDLEEMIFDQLLHELF